MFVDGTRTMIEASPRRKSAGFCRTIEGGVMGTASRESIVEASPPCGPPAQEPTTVLVVDDSAFDRHLVGQLLESLPNIALSYASNGQEGLAVIERDNPAIILTDLIMPDMEGLELVQKVRAQHPNISVILVTAYGSEEAAIKPLR